MPNVTGILQKAKHTYNIYNWKKNVTECNVLEYYSTVDYVFVRIRKNPLLQTLSTDICLYIKLYSVILKHFLHILKSAHIK